MTASLGAATLTFPGTFGLQETQYVLPPVTPYSNVLYTTDFEDYKQPEEASLDGLAKLAHINDVVRKVTSESVPLTERQHAILTDRLFDFL